MPGLIGVLYAKNGFLYKSLLKISINNYNNDLSDKQDSLYIGKYTGNIDSITELQSNSVAFIHISETSGGSHPDPTNTDYYYLLTFSPSKAGAGRMQFAIVLDPQSATVLPTYHRIRINDAWSNWVKF